MTLARNTGWLLAGRIGSQALAVLVTVVLARRLGLEGFAGYAVLVALVWIANVVTTFGTDMVLVREIASGGPIGRWRPALALQLGLSLAAIAALWAVAPLMPGSADGPAALRLLAMALVPMAVTSVATAVLRGMGAMGRYAAVSFGGAALQLIAIWLFVAEGTPLQVVAATLAGAHFGAALLTWGVAAARVPDLRRVGSLRLDEIAAMARASFPIGVLGALGMLYQRGPLVALAAIAGPIGTAYVAAALRVTEASKTGHMAFFSALFPVLASPATNPQTLGRTWRASIGAAIGVAAATVVLGPAAIAVLYGPAFAPAATALAILGVSVIPSTAATYRTLELLAGHRERAVLIGLGVSLAALAAGLALLVPPFGWLGGAWAILGAEFVQGAALFAAGRVRQPVALPRIATVAEPALR